PTSTASTASALQIVDRRRLSTVSDRGSRQGANLVSNAAGRQRDPDGWAGRHIAGPSQLERCVADVEDLLLDRGERALGVGGGELSGSRPDGGAVRRRPRHRGDPPVVLTR